MKKYICYLLFMGVIALCSCSEHTDVESLYLEKYGPIPEDNALYYDDYYITDHSCKIGVVYNYNCSEKINQVYAYVGTNEELVAQCKVEKQVMAYTPDNAYSIIWITIDGLSSTTKYYVNVQVEDHAGVIYPAGIAQFKTK